MHIKVFFIVVFFFFNLGFCQFKTSNPELSNYIKVFESVKYKSAKVEISKTNGYLSKADKKILAMEKYVNTLSEKEVIDLLNKRESVFNNDLYALPTYWLKYDQELERLNAVDSVKWGIFEGLLMQKIKNLYGDSISQLLLSPVVLKATISNITKKPYKLNDISISQRIIEANVVEVLKGSTSFITGQSFQFYFMDFWLKNKQTFIIGETYLISLIPIIDNITNEKRLALNVNDKNNGILLIKNNVLLDEQNYYGYGEIQWEIFKEKIAKYLNMKNY